MWINAASATGLQAPHDKQMAVPGGAAGEKRVSFMIAVAALCFLMLAAYRGFSVILFAPIAALLAVLLTEPSAVLPVYSGLFMDKMVIFVKL
jgi:hypothetical protein